MLGAQQPVAQRGVAPKLVAQQLLHQRPLAALPVGGEGELAAELVRLLWRARLAYGLGGGIVAARLLRLEGVFDARVLSPTVEDCARKPVAQRLPPARQ